MAGFPPLAPVPPPAVRKTIPSNDWDAYLDAWMMLLGIRLNATDKKFDEACATVHRFTDNYISSALQGHAKPGRYNLLAELAQACQDPLQLRNELLNILLAARDTTASLLSSVFYLLARHPAAWKRLNAEVNRLEGQIPDYAALKEMNYLRSVLQESMSLPSADLVNFLFFHFTKNRYSIYMTRGYAK